MNDLIKIKDKLVSQLYENKCLPIASESIEDSIITLTLDSCYPLFITIDEDEIVVIYANEHDNFIRKSCKSDDEWIRSACWLVSLLSSCIIVFCFVHAKSILIDYEIMVKRQDGKMELLKRVVVSSNPFLRFYKKQKTIQEIAFYRK